MAKSPRKPRTKLGSRVRVGNAAVLASSDPQLYDKLFRGPKPTKHYQFLSTDVSVGRYSAIILSWAVAGIGFGEVALYLDKGRVKIDDEGMGPEFCEALLQELETNFWPRKRKSSLGITPTFIRAWYDQVRWPHESRH